MSHIGRHEKSNYVSLSTRGPRAISRRICEAIFTFRRIYTIIIARTYNVLVTSFAIHPNAKASLSSAASVRQPARRSAREFHHLPRSSSSSSQSAHSIVQHCLARAAAGNQMICALQQYGWRRHCCCCCRFGIARRWSRIVVVVVVIVVAPITVTSSQLYLICHYAFVPCPKCSSQNATILLLPADSVHLFAKHTEVESV